MPATEQTWRNTKLLHMVFGFTSLAMLVVTLWMFADDHNREWKDYQQTYYQKLEVWNLVARSREQRNAEYEAAEAAREAEVARQRAEVPGKTLLDLFLAERVYFQVEQAEAKARAKQNPSESSPSESEFTKYVEFLPKARNLLTLQSTNSALSVEMELLRGDAARAHDKDRRAALEAQVKGLTVALSADRAELQRNTSQTAETLAALPKMKEVQGENLPRGEAQQLRDLYQRWTQAERPNLAEARDSFLNALRGVIAQARFEEEKKQRALKFRRADLDVVRSDFDLRLGQGADAEELVSLQSAVDKVLKNVDSLNTEYESFSRHRKELDAVLAAITAGEDAAKKAVVQHRSDLARLETQLNESRPGVGKTILGMPILDAFYNSQIKIKDRWLPELTLNRNFNVVARFDRCESCHLGVLKASPTSPTAPAYEQEHSERIRLSTPNLVAKGDEAFLQRSPSDKELPAAFQEGGGLANFADFLQPNSETTFRSYDAQKQAAFVLTVYGLHLAPEGLWNANDAMLEYVVRESPAAVARLQRGDVLVEIDGQRIDSRERAFHYLTEHGHWGKPLDLKVRRGVPQPFSTHPRLELYGSDLSPHPFGKFGCTICHDGQGNGTEFKWATHSPNTLSQAEDWARRLSWFDDLHWIYPMKPKRFAESNCLKCHHDLSELESSERFPQAPAPNLMEGYHTIRQYGCFGCHEIKGYDGPSKRIGPDLRLEPNYFAAADQLRYELQKRKGADGAGGWQEILDKAVELRNRPEDAALRRQLQHLLASDATRASLPPVAQGLPDLFKDEETPGKMRKVGPSLRHVASKLDDWFIYNQIHDPSGFRPTSRMPQFFGLHGHLQVGKDYGKETNAERLDKTKELEQVEILSIVKYLREKSQPITLVSAPEPKKGDASQLGKFLVQTRGCLACHQHQAFPVPKEEQQDQGPDLSFIGDKLAGKVGDKLAGKDGANLIERKDEKGRVVGGGRTWLYNWLLDPTNYHARTKMPNTFLVPYDEKDAAGKPTGRKIDPALEIMNFLLASRAGKTDRPWAAIDVPDIALSDETLNALAIEHLRGASGFTESQAKNFLANGIPATLRSELKGDEVELLQEPAGGFDKEKKVWAYLGRRSVSKYGCYACHDIPGFEGAKPIGTALNEWGRKETGKIAFEQIAQYVGLADHIDVGHGNGEEHGTKLKNYPDEDKAYFLNSLVHHQRDGFLWQKLRDPRSFDFQKTQNKKYNERLKMPRFRFNPDEKQNAALREKVMTFILGLVNEPPAEKYLYRPDPRKTAINEGRRVLTKYNCGGCHTLELEMWRVEYDPDNRLMSKPLNRLANEYDFLIPPASKEGLERSRLKNERGRRVAVIHGQQARDANTGQIVRNDIEIDGEEKYQVGIELWKPAVINGQVWLAKEQAIVLEEQAKQLRRAVGGTLSRLLPPVLLADEKKRNPAAQYEHALAWGPPPLLNEGRKAQSDWLHRFLLDPYQIRPSVALRMPKFNMSSEEASILVNYFAAVDNVDQYSSSGILARDDRSPARNERLDDAMKIVTNGNYCLKCHHMGNYVPEGAVAPQAPDLADVYRRLRPEYVRDWIANPVRFLPYTGMPVNIAEDKPIRPDQFQIKIGPLVEKGTSLQQLDAVRDFLMNYDRFAQRNEEIKLNEPPKGAKPPGEKP